MRARGIDCTLHGHIGSVITPHAVQSDHDLAIHDLDVPLVAEVATAMLVADFDDLATSVLATHPADTVGTGWRAAVRAASNAIRLDGVGCPTRVTTLTGGLALRNSHVAPADVPPMANRPAGRS